MAIGIQEKKRLRRGLIGFCLLALLAGFWDRIPLTRDWERATLDYRYKHFNRTTKAGPQVVYIDVDEASLKNLASSYGRWPWPRKVYKELVEFLSIGEPAGVFFDIYFTEAQQGTQDDELLAQASSAGKGNVSHAMNLLLDSAAGLDTANPLPADFAGRFSLQLQTVGQDSLQSWKMPRGHEYRDYLLPNPALYQSLKHLHVTTFDKDPDGVFRRVRLLFNYGDQWVPSLALAGVLSTMKDPAYRLEGQDLVLTGADAKTYRIPLDSTGKLPIHFYDVDKSPERIPIDVVLASAAELQKGAISDPSQLKVNPLEFQSKVIVVGGSAAGLEDLKATPIAPSYPGAMLHTTLITNILQQDFLREIPFGAHLALAFLVIALCYGAVLFAPNIGLKAGIPLIAVLAADGVALWLFRNHSLRLDMARPSLLAFIAVMDGFAYVSFVEGAEKKRMKSALVKYVSHSVAEAMIASGQNPSAEVGRTEELSILFSDIRGFTTMSEKFSPAFLVEWLNQYFARMTGLVFEKDGTLDKFIGDALMAFWGAPGKQDERAYRAVSTALAMRRALGDLTKEWQIKYEGKVQIATGVGINSGKVVVGNIGSDMRLEYTVIGDNVNLASRIEGLTKQYHLGLMVSARTRELAGDAFIYRPVDCVQVKGKTTGVMLYEPLAEKAITPETERASLLELSERFSDAWKDYEAGKFAQALGKFEAIQAWRGQDGPCEVYLERCKDLISSPPKEWSGIYVAKSK